MARCLAPPSHRRLHSANPFLLPTGTSPPLKTWWLAGLWTSIQAGCKAPLCACCLGARPPGTPNPAAACRCAALQRIMAWTLVAHSVRCCLCLPSRAPPSATAHTCRCSRWQWRPRLHAVALATPPTARAHQQTVVSRGSSQPVSGLHRRWATWCTAEWSRRTVTWSRCCHAWMRPAR